MLLPIRLPLAAPDGRHLQYKTVLSNLPTSAAYQKPDVLALLRNASSAEAPASSKEFVNRVWPHAVEASRSTGVPPQFLVGAFCSGEWLGA
jgi:flagellar protein FlgJ